MATTTGTPPDLKTLTVKAVDVKVGDLIGGRTVRQVHKKPQSCTARYSSPTRKDYNPRNALPPLTFSCHIVTVFFTDYGVPLLRWPQRLVEVQRP